MLSAKGSGAAFNTTIISLGALARGFGLKPAVSATSVIHDVLIAEHRVFTPRRPPR
jgi:hypothetical protein